MALRIRERPPLRLSHDIEAPSGRHYRWAEDEPRAENIPSSVQFSDTMPGGFENGGAILPRKSEIAYSDLERLSTWTIYGPGGEVAWEGRLERALRVSGEQMAVSPSAVGWQAHLEDDQSVRENYFDRDISHWTGPSRARRLAIYAAGAVPMDASAQGDPTSSQPAVSIEWQDQPAVRWLGEALYDSGGGSTVANIHYDIARDNTTEIRFYVGDSDTDLTDTSPNLTAGGIGTYTPATPRRFGFFQAERGASAANSMYAHLRNPVVVGDHGLSTVVVVGGYDGLYGSNVVAHVVDKWAPLLIVKSDSVQSSSFVISHLAFLEPTTAGEIIRQVTRFGLEDWAVWESKEFVWHQRGARGRKWRARISPSQFEETGQDAARLFESVVVQYQDVDGSTRTVGPIGSGSDTESADLKDDDSENPANKLGITKRALLQMGVATVASATEVGRRFLEEQKLLDRSGRARLVGHVQDDRGVWHPYWKVRAGDYISFVDSSDTSYRRIVKTDKTHSERACSVDLDAPPEGLQALLERLSVVLVPLGL